MSIYNHIHICIRKKLVPLSLKPCSPCFINTPRCLPLNQAATSSLGAASVAGAAVCSAALLVSQGRKVLLRVADASGPKKTVISIGLIIGLELNLCRGERKPSYPFIRPFCRGLSMF